MRLFNLLVHTYFFTGVLLWIFGIFFGNGGFGSVIGYTGIGIMLSYILLDIIIGWW